MIAHCISDGRHGYPGVVVADVIEVGDDPRRRPRCRLERGTERRDADRGQTHLSHDPADKPAQCWIADHDENSWIWIPPRATPAESLWLLSGRRSLIISGRGVRLDGTDSGKHAPAWMRHTSEDTVTRFAVVGLIALVLAVQLLLPRAVAGSGSVSDPSFNPRVTPIPSATPTRTPSAAERRHVLEQVTPTPTTTVVIGDATVEVTVDGLVPGTAKAFPYSTTHNGTVGHLNVYLDATNKALHFQVGLYADSGTGHPGTLLTSGNVSNPVAGQWNTVQVGQVSISADQSTYWIALLSGGPGMRIRDTVHGGVAELSQETTLKRLPTTWTTSTTFTRAPASAYGS
jgi:hypothetical protein